MRHKTKYLIIGLLYLTFISCINSGKNKKKVFYINSYHQGYPSSDQVQQGIVENLDSSLFEMKIEYLDSKRITDEEELEMRIKKTLNGIKQFQPDILLASDDNAIKSIIAPYFYGSETPIIFCGVNWSADQYNLSRKNTTGMLEILPLKELITKVNSVKSGIKNFVVLSENSLSELNNKILLDTLFRNLNLQPTYTLVDNFEQWKSSFILANQTADLIYLPTNGAIKNWNTEEAKQLVDEHIKVPIITCDDFMMPYAVFGLTKIAKEQGEWVAKTTKEILLSGKKPSEIPISKNNLSKAYINKKLAEKIDFDYAKLDLKNSVINE